jgi:SPP1 gp7 family putative phage head morphogenesis protein
MPGKILRLLTHHLPTKRRTARRAKAVRPSRANELWYKTRLRELVRRLRASVNANILPLLKARALTVDASLEDEIGAAFERMAREFGGLDALAQRLAAEGVQKNLAAVDSSMAKNLKSAVGIDVSRLMPSDRTIAEKMAAANRANVELIKSIPSEYFDRIRVLVESNVDGGFRYEDIVDKIKEAGDITDRRADLIARDQTSKMNSAFNEARQTSLGIESYIWQGAADERERETHVANNGLTFRWDDPPAETGHPGEDVQCRCVAIPVFDLG